MCLGVPWPFTLPLVHSPVHSHLLAPHSSLRSRAPLRSFDRSLAHSLTPELMERISYSFSPLCGPTMVQINLRTSNLTHHNELRSERVSAAGRHLVHERADERITPQAWERASGAERLSKGNAQGKQTSKRTSELHSIHVLKARVLEAAVEAVG